MSIVKTIRKGINERVGRKEENEFAKTKAEKTKVAIFPSFVFEVGMATVLDKEKFEIVPMDVTSKDVTDKFGQEVYGDWCFPLKFAVAVHEQAVVEGGAQVVMGVNFNVCRYPLVMGDIKKWVKKDFEYYPVMVDKVCPSLVSYVDALKQLNKTVPGFDKFKALKRVPLAVKRALMTGDIEKLYFKNLPLVKNPRILKNDFNSIKRKFIMADTMKESKEIFEGFRSRTEKQAIRQKPKYRFMITGDFSVNLAFPIIELDIFMAKHGAEIVTKGLPATMQQLKLSKNWSRSKEIISKHLSTKTQKIEVSERHLIEALTLYEILEVVEQGVDGIIFIKPTMCTPCDNLSYVIREEKNFGLPMVEITYDGHHGVNGIITRLEAFINIVSERK